MQVRRHAALFVAISLSALFGNWNGASTGIDITKLLQFPLVKIRSGWLKDGSSVMFDGITATSAGGGVREVRLSGVGSSGKRWEAHTFGLDEVWRGDLDGNGTQDYVFFASGPYFNGRATPLFSLSILLMDEEGLPVPFFTVVYKGENGDGIRHLVDLNHDGHAGLLVSTYDENASDPLAGPFGSGHWTTQLYQFVDFGVEEIRGTVGGIRFPFVHDWTYRTREHTSGVRPLSSVHPATLTEHGTGRKEELITKIRKAGAEGGGISIEAAAGCKTIFPSVVVYDRPRIRQIGFPSQWNNYTINLADTIRGDGVQVQLRGINKRSDKSDCSANLVWATSLN
jgi:hypothetical protein